MLPQAAADFYRSQQQLAALTIAQNRRAWAGMGNDFDTSWARIGQRVTVLTALAQRNAAVAAMSYVPELLDETGQRDDPVAELDPDSLAGTASDGRALDTLLYGGVVRAKESVGAGASPREALDAGRRWLDLATQTLVADAGRVAVSTLVAARPRLTGYVRMLNPPSCSRCVVLAGKWTPKQEAFNRHLRCDCVNIPASEDVADSMTTDAKAYFDHLPEAEQDRVFTSAGAAAIRNGADLNQVVNVRRGANGLSTASPMPAGRVRRGLVPIDIGGRKVFLSTEGASKRGLSSKSLNKRPRLMPETIQAIAGTDQAEAVRLLKANGYLVAR